MNSGKPDLAILALTDGGKKQAMLLKQRLLTQHITCDCFTSDHCISDDFQGFSGSMAACVQRLFPDYSALLFICATGITVRMIAPLIKDKLTDPAVLVMDEQAQYVISLLSGHVGGANELTKQIAELMNASPVITTATDVNQLSALDLLIKAVDAEPSDYREQIKMINQQLVNKQRVGLYLDHVSVKDTRGFITVADLRHLPNDLDALVVISPKTNLVLPSLLPVVTIIPKVIVAGIGCRRDTPFTTLYHLLSEHFAQYHLDLRALKQVGSVEIKQGELALIALAEQLHIPFVVFSINELKQYEHRFPVSDFVQKTLGIGSISQPVAWIMSHGVLLGGTVKQAGITITLGVNECCI